jgi:hypothetical protein
VLEIMQEECIQVQDKIFKKVRVISGLSKDSYLKVNLFKLLMNLDYVSIKINYINT